MAANGVVKEAAANELSSTKAQALEENNKMLAAKALDKWFKQYSKNPKLDYSRAEVKANLDILYPGTNYSERAFDKNGNFNDFRIGQEETLSDTFKDKQDQAKAARDKLVSKSADIVTAMSVPDTVDHDVTYNDLVAASQHNKNTSGNGKGKYYYKVDENGVVQEKIQANSDYSAQKLLDAGYREVNVELSSDQRLYDPTVAAQETLSFKNDKNSQAAFSDYEKALQEIYPSYETTITGNDGTEVKRQTRGEDYDLYRNEEFFRSVYASSYSVKSEADIPEGTYYMENKDGIRGIKENQLKDPKHKELLEKIANDEKVSMIKYKPKIIVEKEEVKDNELKINKEKVVEDEALDEYKDEIDHSMTIAGHRVEYVRASGSNKIKFPKTEKYVDIMGLPPMSIESSILTGDKVIEFSSNISDHYEDDIVTSRYDSYDQLTGSFPILKIHPVDVEILRSGVRNKGQLTMRNLEENQGNIRAHVINEVEYKFAVQTSNSIQYSHTNQFGESGVENELKKIAQTFNSISQIQNLSDAMGGATSEFATQLGSIAKDISSKLDDQMHSWTDYAKEDSSFYQNNKEIMGFFEGVFNAGKDILSGGRIDIPDVWIDSNTSNSHSFRIELRTLNPNPRSRQYFADILLPLYSLLTLALPTEGQTFLYKTPTYITANLDNSFWEIKFGAITSLNWTIDTNYINFKKVPTHIIVDLTIQDMYKLMPQAVFDSKNEEHTTGHNKDMMTKDTYIDNFVRNFPGGPGGSSDLIKVPNEAYYLTEFSAIPGYQESLEKYKKEKEEQRANDEKMASENANKGAGNSKVEEKAIDADGEKIGDPSQTESKTNNNNTNTNTNNTPKEGDNQTPTEGNPSTSGNGTNNTPSNNTTVNGNQNGASSAGSSNNSGSSSTNSSNNTSGGSSSSSSSSSTSSTSSSSSSDSVPKVDKVVALKKDPKTNKTSFITSIGNAITSVTNEVKNVIAGTNKAIPQVKDLINKGAILLNSAQNLKSAIKCAGKTANISGILNGSFADSVGAAFQNLGKASDVISDITNGAIDGRKIGKAITDTVSSIAQKALNDNLPGMVSEDGKKVSVIDQIKGAVSAVRGAGDCAKTIMNAVASVKNTAASSNTTDPLSKLQAYITATEKVINSPDFNDKILKATKESAINHNCYTAGQMASNAKLQDKLKDVVTVISDDAAKLTKQASNDAVLSYLQNQPWFKENFKLKKNATGASIGDYEIRNPNKASEISTKLDDAWLKVSSGVKNFTEVSGDVVSDAAISGIANNCPDTTITVKITSANS